MLPAEVHGAAGHGVVEKAVASGPVTAEVKGQVLVQGVAPLRPKAHGVPGVEQKPLPRLVHRAALVAEAEDLLPLEPIHIVDGAGPQLPGKVIGKAAPVPIQKASLRLGADAKVFELNGEIRSVQGKEKNAVPFQDFRRRQIEALGGQLVPACKGHVRPLGAYAPGGKQGHMRVN